MSNYEIAWIVVVFFGLLSAYGAYRLLPNMSHIVSIPLVCAVFAFLVTPAPVPEFAGEYAPAFIVFIFELLFQTDGQPDNAGSILLTVVACAALVAFLVMLAIRKRLKIETPEQVAEESSST